MMMQQQWLKQTTSARRVKNSTTPGTYSKRKWELSTRDAVCLINSNDYAQNQSIESVALN